MTLKDIISTIPAIDKVSIQDSNGVVYLGDCCDFKATYVGAYGMLDLKVDAIRADQSVIIILLDR